MAIVPGWPLRVVGAGALLATSLWSASAGGEDRPGRPANLQLVRGVAGEAIRKLVANLEVPGRRVEVRVDPFHEAGWFVQDLVGDVLRARGLEVVEARIVAPSAADSARAAADTSQAEPPEAPQAAPADSSKAAASDSTRGAGVDSTHAARADTTHGAGADTTHAAKGDTARMSGGSARTNGDAARAAAAEAFHPPVDARLDIRVLELGLRYADVHRGRLFFGRRTVERFAAARLHGELRCQGDPAIRWSADAEASALDEVPTSALMVLQGLDYPFTKPSLPASSASRVIEPVIVSVIVLGLVFLFVSNRN